MMSREELHRFVYGYDPGPTTTACGTPAPTMWKGPRTPGAASRADAALTTTEEATRAYLAMMEAIPDGYATPCFADPRTWTAETPSPEQLRAAERGCARCPVREQCAAYAEALRPTCGIWAGVSWSGSYTGRLAVLPTVGTPRG